MRRHLAPQQLGQWVPVDASVDLQQGVEKHWFYVKNNAAAPLLEFTERLIEEVLESWRRWGVLEKDKKKIQDYLATIRVLKERGVKGSGMIGAYHMRRVAPLMRRALPLHMMAPRVALDGTALAEGALSPLQSGTAHQGGDGAFTGRRRRCS